MKVGDFCSLGRIDHLRHARERTPEAETHGAGDDQLGTKQGAALGERARHIVRLSDKGDPDALDPPEQLLDGEKVRERLKRMMLRREHVEHRRGVHRGHLLQ